MSFGFTVRRSAYFDSVALMRVAEQARQLGGVTEVAAVMGTPANRAMLAEAGMLPPDAPATEASDLLVVVSASSDAAAGAALARVTDLLATRRETGPEPDDVQPRTLVSAARSGAPQRPAGAPQRPAGAHQRPTGAQQRPSGAATLAVVAVPGPYAALEAHQALSAGLHVFLFSDGVALEDEVALKRRARGRGLFVMGPECGTSIIHGVGLGFANRVRRGAIGVVGASGTGIQEVTTLVHRLGAGVSHAIGTGGRDLHAAVGGITTLQALARLGAADDTRVIVIVSKPSSREVADGVLAAAARIGKPVIACLLGYDGATPDGVRAVATLEEAAVAAVRLVNGRVGELSRSGAVVRTGAPGAIRGLFTGGTLCDEAKRLAGGSERLAAEPGRLAAAPERLADELAHRFIDFGAEEYTRGRPHPIIDPRRRHAAILEAAEEPGVRVLLLDLVLGDCAHPDPAGALDPVLAGAYERARRAGRELSVVAHVVGTDGDAQDLARQEDTLRKRGVVVCASNRMAALTARGLAEGREPAPGGREPAPGGRDVV